MLKTYSGTPIKIIIPTIESYNVPRERLYSSFNNLIDDESLVYVYSKHNTSGISINPKQSIKVYTTKNLYEYFGFFIPMILSQLDSKYSNYLYLLIHDTCEFGNQSVEKIIDICSDFEKEKLDLLWLSPNGQSNFCIFNNTSSIKVYKKLSHFGELEKIIGVRMENETDHPYSIKSIQDLNMGYINIQQQHLGISYPYSTQKRNVVYYPSIDIKKYFVYVEFHNNQVHPEVP